MICMRDSGLFIFGFFIVLYLISYIDDDELYFC